MHTSRSRNIGRAMPNIRQFGWQVLVVWECQTRDVGRLEERLRRFLSPG